MQRHAIEVGSAVHEVTAALVWPTHRNTLPVDYRVAPAATPPRSTAAPPPESGQRDQILSVLEQVGEQLDALADSRRQSLHELQALAVHLAVKIARAVVLREIEDDTHRVQQLAERAVQMLGADARLVLKVHPDIHARLEHEHSELLRRDSLQIKADPALPIGDCRIEGEDYTLFAGIDEKLQLLERKLLEGLSDAQIERRSSGSSDRKLQRFPDRRNTA